MKHDKELKRIIDMELNENIRRIREMMIFIGTGNSPRIPTMKRNHPIRSPMINSLKIPNYQKICNQLFYYK